MISLTNLSTSAKESAVVPVRGERSRLRGEWPIAETGVDEIGYLDASGIGGYRRVYSGFSAVRSTGPPLTLQPEDGPVSANLSPKTVGAPSVKSAMYFISAVEVFGVALHFRMAAPVFVKPPAYAMPLTAAFAAASC